MHLCLTVECSTSSLHFLQHCVSVFASLRSNPLITHPPSPHKKTLFWASVKVTLLGPESGFDLPPTLKTKLPTTCVQILEH